MVTAFSLTLLVAVVLFCSALIVVARPLCRDFALAQDSEAVREDNLHPAAVILCVRGSDPTLPVCLTGLLNQDYHDYEIHVVLDNDSDPAARLVRSAVRKHDARNIRIHTLSDPDSRRGLKVSAILQALESLSNNVEAIAFLDADAEPDPAWLRNLVRPLGDKNVGATSGLRWFDPEIRNAGSLIRAKWNLYALILMRHCNIAWGGSLAIRRDVLITTDLKQKWAETVCEDTCVGDALAEAGLKVQLVPEVAMTNREQTGMIGCWRFMVRQLVFTRLHSRNWWMMLLFGLTFAVLAVAFPMLGAISVIAQNIPALAIVTLAFLTMVSVVSRFERTMDEFANRHAAPVSESDRKMRTSFITSAIANYLCRTSCVLMSGLAIIQASLTRQLNWRGVTYDVSRSRIRLREYKPFVPAPESESELGRMSI